MPTQGGPDLHRDKLGLADDADRQALRELRIVAPIALIIGLVIWIAGAGPYVLLPTATFVFAYLMWRAALLRRKARREYRAGR